MRLLLLILTLFLGNEAESQTATDASFWCVHVSNLYIGDSSVPDKIVSIGAGGKIALIDKASGPTGATGASGINGLTGATGIAGSPTEFADFYALMPSDNPLTISVLGAVRFPQLGSTSGTITSVSPTSFNIPHVGNYLIYFQVSVDEAGQMGISVNGTIQASSIVGRATGTTQIIGTSLITTVLPNTTISVINTGSAAALTVTPFAGGTGAVSAHLIITRLSDGRDGNTGATGAQGITGNNGTNGVTGANGNTGIQGIAGNTGSTGLTGSNGSVGATGESGTQGATGATGGIGVTGTAGTNGTNGTNGSTGPTGLSGAVGGTGPSGTNGSNGATGPTGVTDAYYTKYEATITQTGSSAPTVTRRDANFAGVTFTWARASAGTYTLTANSAVFTSGKTAVYMSVEPVGTTKFSAVWTSTTVITVTTNLQSVGLISLLATLLSTATDGLITNGSVEVKVYN